MGEEAAALVFNECCIFSFAERFHSWCSPALECTCRERADAVVGGYEVCHEGCEEVPEGGDGVYGVAADDVDTSSEGRSKRPHCGKPLSVCEGREIWTIELELYVSVREIVVFGMKVMAISFVAFGCDIVIAVAVVR